MEQDLLQRLDAQDKKLEEIQISVEKTKKYLLGMIIVSVLAVVIPMIGLLILIPWLFNTLSSSLSL